MLNCVKPLCTNGLFLLFVVDYIKGINGSYFQVFYFILSMFHYAAFHVGLHCLLKYSFKEFPSPKGYNKVF